MTVYILHRLVHSNRCLPYRQLTYWQTLGMQSSTNPELRCKPISFHSLCFSFFARFKVALGVKKSTENNSVDNVNPNKIINSDNFFSITFQLTSINRSVKSGTTLFVSHLDYF